MTIKLVTDKKIAETSSKGNQEKWFDSEENVWYKLDLFGYEALAETVVSKLLKLSNIEENGIKITDYYMTKVASVYKGIHIKTTKNGLPTY